MRRREYVWIKYKMSLETKAIMDEFYKQWRRYRNY
jgi:hypothetical protein